MKKTNRGFTMLEIMVALVIMGIIAAFAFPSFRNMIENKQLKSVTESLYNDLKLAHSEAIKKQTAIFVSFQPGANWCYGIDDTAACNCNVVNDCEFEGAEKVIRGTDYKNTVLAVNGWGAGIPFIFFEGTRGMSNRSAGAATFTTNTKTTNIASNRIGRIEICSDSLIDYKGC